MVDKNFLRDLKRNKPPGSRGHSNLYRYILEHWDGIQACGYGTDGGPTWQELTDRLARHGQVNARGAPLQRLKVREVFLRVQADVLMAQAQRRTGAVTKTAASRAPKGWRPPLAEKQSFPQAPRSPFAPPRSTPESSASDDMSPDELMAGIRRVIQKRSGR